MGLPIPEEYGGSGIDQLGYVLEIEELAKVCATTAIIVSAKVKPRFPMSLRKTDFKRRSPLSIQTVRDHRL